jgi:hypothetical protein
MLCQRLTQTYAKPCSRLPALGRPGAAHVSRAKTWFGAAAAAGQTQGNEGQSSYGSYAQHIEPESATSAQQRGKIHPWLVRVPQLVPRAVAVAAAVALASLLVPHVAQAAAAAATAGQEDSLVKSKPGHMVRPYMHASWFMWGTHAPLNSACVADPPPGQRCLPHIVVCSPCSCHQLHLALGQAHVSHDPAAWDHNILDPVDHRLL